MDLRILRCTLNVISHRRFEDLKMIYVGCSRQLLLSAFRNMFCRKHLQTL